MPKGTGLLMYADGELWMRFPSSEGVRAFFNAAAEPRQCRKNAESESCGMSCDLELLLDDVRGEDRRFMSGVVDGGTLDPERSGHQPCSRSVQPYENKTGKLQLKSVIAARRLLRGRGELALGAGDVGVIQMPSERRRRAGLIRVGSSVSGNVANSRTSDSRATGSSALSRGVRPPSAGISMFSHADS